MRVPVKTGYFQKSETSTICVDPSSLVPPTTRTKFELNIVWFLKLVIISQKNNYYLPQSVKQVYIA